MTNATITSNLDGSATVSVTTKPPASLGSGIFSDSVQLKVCYDSACTKPAAGSPFTVQVLYIVDASPGVDFTQTSIPVEVWAMAWNATTQRFYATANSDTGGIAHSLLVINPVTASIEQVVSLGQDVDPTSIALTDNGQYAYIISLGAVIRVDLGTRTIDETVNVAANSIKTVPGEPDSFVVETPIRSSSFMMERRRGRRVRSPEHSKATSSLRSASMRAPSTPTILLSPHRPCTSCR